MNKLVAFIFALMISSSPLAQGLFWTFDDNQKPVVIPEECEGRFDEVRGGVFYPTTEDLYEYGKTFLSSTELEIQQQGAYCVLSAALQGHAPSQFIMAQLYEQGKVLPQDDLSAYKWAFMAALGGEKDAERYTLTLEQFLTTDELERTNGAIQETRQKVQANIQRQIDEERAKMTAEREELARLSQEIQDQGGHLKKTPAPATDDLPTDDQIRAVMPDVNAVFGEGDRL